MILQGSIPRMSIYWGLALLVCIAIILPTYTNANTLKPVNVKSERSLTYDVLLDLPFGKGPGAVGVVRKAGAPPQYPTMFQMMPDGTIWVLDTDNSRILAFRNGKQIKSISTASHQKYPTHFGVTGNTVWVEKIHSTNQGPDYNLLRYSAANRPPTLLRLKIRNGVLLAPLKILSHGASASKLIISGRAYPPYHPDMSIILNNDGKIDQVIEKSWIIPAADGGILRFNVTDQIKPDSLPFTVDKFDTSTGSWQTIIKGALPRREELSQQRKIAIRDPLGIDSHDRIAVVLSEGKHLSSRFFWISKSGTIEQSITQEELGLGSVSFLHYQLMPDGSILAQYLDLDKKRYRILRISP